MGEKGWGEGVDALVVVGFHVWTFGFGDGEVLVATLALDVALVRLRNSLRGRSMQGEDDERLKNESIEDMLANPCAGVEHQKVT